MQNRSNGLPCLGDGGLLCLRIWMRRDCVASRQISMFSLSHEQSGKRQCTPKSHPEISHGSKRGSRWMLLELVTWEGVLCLGSGVPRDADGRDTHGDQPGRAGLSKTQRGRGNGGNQWLVCVCVQGCTRPGTCVPTYQCWFLSQKSHRNSHSEDTCLGSTFISKVKVHTRFGLIFAWFATSLLPGYEPPTLLAI